MALPISKTMVAVASNISHNLLMLTTAFSARFVLITLLCTFGGTARAEFVIKLNPIAEGGRMELLVHPQSRTMEPVDKLHSVNLPETHNFSSKEGLLYFQGGQVGRANYIWAEAESDKCAVAVVSQDFNSVSSPWELLRAFSGHPVQYSVISLIVICPGQLNWVTDLEKQYYVGHWQASIEQIATDD